MDSEEDPPVNNTKLVIIVILLLIIYGILFGLYMAEIISTLIFLGCAIGLFVFGMILDIILYYTYPDVGTCPKIGLGVLFISEGILVGYLLSIIPPPII